jgi:hypothetical protein
MEDWTKVEIEQIRSTVEVIKKCQPRTDTLAKGAATITVWIPYNVTWDVTPSSSIRAPYSGYIEVVIGSKANADFVKCKKAHFDCTTFLSDFAKVTAPTVYRYEFDLAPNGLNVRRLLTRKENEHAWGNDPAFSNGSCWDKAVKDAQANPTKAPTVGEPAH